MGNVTAPSYAERIKLTVSSVKRRGAYTMTTMTNPYTLGLVKPESCDVFKAFSGLPKHYVSTEDPFTANPYRSREMPYTAPLATLA
jgi:hypothetical protein